MITRVWVVIDTRHDPNALASYIAYSDRAEAERQEAILKKDHNCPDNSTAFFVKELVLQ